VDGVLVYATAELGPLLGGVSGGLLYICYAVSSAFLAKNVLYQLKARRAVLFGMVCLLTYVSTFLLALAIPDIKWIVCIIGSITGGFGAGIMWTAQGSYYALNGSMYVTAINNCSDEIEHNYDISGNSIISINDYANERRKVLNKFAGYFAAIYLCSESVCKMLITGLFLILSKSRDDDDDEDNTGKIGSWQVISFFAFTLVAWISTGFSFGILNLSALKQEYETELYSTSLLQNTSSECDTLYTSSGESENRPSSTGCVIDTAATAGTSGSSSILNSFLTDLSAVLSFIKDHESFRYLLPYQFSFGFSSTYMGFLVYGIILNDNGKEGFIGLLSALSVLFAGGLAIPVAAYTNRKKKRIKGSRAATSMTDMHVVMLAGAVIFVACAAFPLYLSDETIASWPVIVPLVCTYGAGRSIWENSNKALIANIFSTTDGDDNDNTMDISNSFRMSISSVNECADEEKSPQESSHERAFAAIYFVSGVGAAIGFFIFKFFSSMTIAALTAGVGLVALCSNHYFFMHCKSDK
jgi:hypothetical protein